MRGILKKTFSATSSQSTSTQEDFSVYLPRDVQHNYVITRENTRRNSVIKHPNSNPHAHDESYIKHGRGVRFRDEACKLSTAICAKNLTTFSSIVAGQTSAPTDSKTFDDFSCLRDLGPSQELMPWRRDNDSEVKQPHENVFAALEELGEALTTSEIFMSLTAPWLNKKKKTPEKFCALMFATSCDKRTTK